MGQSFPKGSKSASQPASLLASLVVNGVVRVAKPSFREASFPITFPFADGGFGSKFAVFTKNVISSKFEMRGKPLRQRVKRPGSHFVVLYLCIEVNTYAIDHTLNFVSVPRWTDTLRGPHSIIT